MACTVSSARMSAPEQACCRAMSSQCGNAKTAMSHRCCQRVPADMQAAVPQIQAAAVHTLPTQLGWLQTTESLLPAVGPAARLYPREDAPPKIPKARLTPLRI